MICWYKPVSCWTVMRVDIDIHINSLKMEAWWYEFKYDLFSSAWTKRKVKPPCSLELDLLRGPESRFWIPYVYLQTLQYDCFPVLWTLHLCHTYPAVKDLWLFFQDTNKNIASFLCRWSSIITGLEWHLALFCCTSGRWGIFWFN